MNLPLFQSAFVFAWNAYFVKEFHQDFVDVIFVRSLVQMLIFGGLAMKKDIEFLPPRQDLTPSQYWTKCFLMIFQVSPNNPLSISLTAEKIGICHIKM